MQAQANARPRPAGATLAVLLSAAAATAQAQFLEMGKLQWPTANEPARRVVAGDLDGDGHVDLVTGSQPVRTHRNLGGGSFAPGAVLDSVYEGELLLFDAEGDGDLDLVVVSDRIVPQLWLNDGAGNFQLAGGRLPAPAYSMAAGDVDGDGDQDLVAGRWFGPAMLWLNDGSGRFTDVTGTHMPALDRRTQSVAFADIDGDGDLDLFLGNVGYILWPYYFYPGYSVLCVNDGTGRFRDATAQLYAYGGESAVSVAFTDVDRDGDPDLIVGGLGLRLHRNDGTGRLVDHEPITTGCSTVARFAVGDLDGDGAPDIVAVGGELLPYLNDGSGRFTASSPLPEQAMRPKDVAAADVDGDRDIDLLAAGEYRSRLLLNDGRGKFADATMRPLPITQIAQGILADFDGDGDVDAATTGSGTSSGIWRNDGGGWFTASTRPVPYLDGYPLVACDVDGDRDLDLLLGVYGYTPSLYLNDGSAGFTDGTAGRIPSLRASHLVAGDVDGDGDADVVTSNRDFGPLTLLSNDGRGTFTARTLATVPSYGMLLADVDRDGDLDLIAGEYGQRLRQFRNDGRGTFTEAAAATMPANNVWATELLAGDVDGDGDPDLVVARGLFLYLNDGLGTFTDGTAGRIPGGLSSAMEIALGDVDDDGDLDLAGAQVYETQTGNYQGILLLNDGRGVFREARERVAGRFPSFGARLADVDGDGDLDLYDASYLHVNLHRHCHAPWLARIGYPYRIDLYSQPGYGTGVHLALPALADAPASLPLPPFGRLGLEPSRTVKLPVVAIGAGGLGSTTLSVPNDQALVGLHLYVQALLVTSPDLSRARLTNVVQDVIGAR